MSYKINSSNRLQVNSSRHKRSSSSSSSSSNSTYVALRNLSLQNLNAAQHFLLAMGRDISFIVPILGLINSIKKAWDLNMNTLQKYPDIEDMPNFYKTINISQNSNSNNNISYNANDFKSLNDIRPSYLSAIIRGRSSEFLMCGLWCIVSMYLTYVTLDALMVRWITIYSTTAAILRMVSISLLLIIIELFILKTLSNEPIVSNGKNFKFGGENSLHAWIFISCVLTGVYIWQSFWTSFLQQQKRKNGHIYEEEKKEKDEINQQNGSIVKPFTTTLQFWKYTLKKHLDLYSIIVFAVVPVGFASFLTMIVLLRNLVIQRMDVEQLEKVWYEINKELLI
ncbi:hypothetical protein HANVADRAFT_25679 [Hanseniaspora valbyensis NRRL Y-1626]|uniref:N-glycosylation protein EOS1 n=1 Tax=Hanseniaspora valbyensis NRRL Y-1626 TaxID=766949 RepID=A0A1B7TBR6_9ASCO|nr:hypothetical protein HANVADRAFT_25679 [Hanseniaspora valbyensis NRRL Y-1626]